MRSSPLIRVFIGLAGALLMVLVAWFFTRPAADAGPPPATAPTGSATAQLSRTFTTAATPPPVEDDRALRDIPTEEMFQSIVAILGVEGARAGETLTLTIPRSDVLLLVDGYEVPTAAGVNHTFHFYRCPCGTMLVHGHYLLHDYELNDVIDALRQTPDLHITATAPFLLAANPRLTLLRFQGEADPRILAAALKRPFRWIGPNRTSVHPTDAIPQ